jgi:hypothetical protein
VSPQAKSRAKPRDLLLSRSAGVSPQAKQEHKEYKTRHIRMSDEAWEELKEKRRKSGLSWNLFVKSLSQKSTRAEESRAATPWCSAE